MTVFEHKKDDVAFGVRFRADVWNYIDAKMHNRKYNPNKRHNLGKRYYWGVASSHFPSKSVHTVVDELLRKLMETEKKYGISL